MCTIVNDNPLLASIPFASPTNLCLLESETVPKLNVLCRLHYLNIRHWSETRSYIILLSYHFDTCGINRSTFSSSERERTDWVLEVNTGVLEDNAWHEDRTCINIANIFKKCNYVLPMIIFVAILKVSFFFRTARSVSPSHAGSQRGCTTPDSQRRALRHSTSKRASQGDLFIISASYC